MSIVNTLSIVLNLNELKSEMRVPHAKVLCSVLSSVELSHSNEVLILFQRVAKNYPEWIHEVFASSLHEFLSRVLFKTPTSSIDHRKKIITAFKVIEEWLKNHK